MIKNALYVVFIVLTLGCGLQAQACPDSPTVTPLSTALNSGRIVTFDDLGLVGAGNTLGIAWNSESGPRSVSASVNQDITISGSPNPHCYIAKGVINGVDAKMDGNQFWTGSTTEKPGFYIFSDRTGVCQFNFNPPISAFVVRANSEAFDGSVTLEVYDEALHSTIA